MLITAGCLRVSAALKWPKKVLAASSNYQCNGNATPLLWNCPLISKYNNITANAGLLYLSELIKSINLQTFVL